MAKYAIVTLGVLLSLHSVCQPFLNSVDPISAGIDETITISGSGFSATASENIVYLGSGRATILSATENLLQVQVPANATSGPIVVSSNELSATYFTNFIYSFGSTSFSSTLFDSQVDIVTNEIQTYDICTCDIDGDGDNDLVVTNNETPSIAGETSEVLVYENLSTPTTVDLATPVRLGVQPTIKVTCSDLNSDGFPDIVATEGASSNDEVFIYENSGSGMVATSFSTFPDISFAIPRDAANNIRNPELVEIADMDLDGLVDIVIGNLSNEEIDIYLNTSSAGSLSFSPNSVQVSVPTGSTAPRGVILGDLNGDNVPELVASENNDNSIFAFRNLSTPGNIQFDDPVIISVIGSQFRNVELGDFNGDDLLDVAATDIRLGMASGNVIIAANQTNSIGGPLVFDTPTVIATLSQPWGLAIGDLDGDGDSDIAVTSESQSTMALFLNNTLDPNTLLFTNNTLDLDFNSRNIGISDLNGDAKSDIFFTSNSVTGRVGSVGIIINRNCVVPSINPTTGIYCPGIPFEIAATNSLDASYSWEVDEGTGFLPDASSTNNLLDISSHNAATIDVRVTLTTNDGSCTETSSSVSFQTQPIATSNPTLVVPASVCSGEDLILQTPDIAANYFWTGPNDFELTTTTSSVTIPNAGGINSGVYSLQIQDAGQCNSMVITENVQVFSVPVLTIINDDPETFCDGGNTQLRIRDIPNITYQWLENAINLPGETTTGLNVDRSGQFSVLLTDDNSCSDTTVAILITEVSPPVSVVTTVDEICQDVSFDLATSSVGDPNFSLSHNWFFQNELGTNVGTLSGPNVSFAFAETGVSTATLTTDYVELPGCNSTNLETINVSAPPNLTLSAPNGTEKCPSDSLLLQIDPGLSSYTWVDITNTPGDTLFQFNNLNSAFGNTAEGFDNATFQVTVTNDVNCTVTEAISINNFANGGISISSNELAIQDGVITIPINSNGVELIASGGSEYLWEPREIFDDSTAATVRAFPRNTMTSITLTGIDSNGCMESSSVILAK